MFSAIIKSLDPRFRFYPVKVRFELLYIIYNIQHTLGTKVCVLCVNHYLSSHREESFGTSGAYIFI
jgi:hypothetical protein